MGHKATSQQSADATAAPPAAASGGSAACPITAHSTLGAVSTATEGITALADAFLVGTDHAVQEQKRAKVLNRYIAENLRATYVQLFATTLIPATQSVDVPIRYSIVSESSDRVVVTILMASFASIESGVKQQAGFVDLTLTWSAAVAEWQISALKNRALSQSSDLVTALSTGKEFCHVPTAD